MTMHRVTGNMNGEDGQTGALRSASFAADFTLGEVQGGMVVEVDPDAAGGSVEVTLPADECGPGFFVEVAQVTAGTVSFVAADGTSIVSPGGATTLTQQWTTARLRRRDDGTWMLEGALS